MKTKMRPGFEYLVEIVGKDGQVRSSELIKNLMPTEGLNHMVGVTLKGAAQITSWFVGLYEGNYTPIAADTAATFPGTATECSAYDETTREALTLGSVASGAVDNGASKAEFTMNAAKTVYGGFITSASAKGATSGTLLSAVRFSSPKVLADEEVLRVTAGFTLVSA